MRKKIFLMLICAVSALIMLAGCGSNDNLEIAGEWVPTTVSLNGTTIKYDELGVEKDKFGFTFTENGKCTATIAGIKGESEYTFNGTSVDIELNGEQYKLGYDKGSLTLTLNDGGEYTLFTFTKVK